MVGVSLFDFFGEASHEQWIKYHQITIVQEPRNQRDFMFATKQKKLVKPCGECGYYGELSVGGSETSYVRDEGKDSSMQIAMMGIFLIDKVLEDIECSSWHDPTMHKGNSHNFA